MEKPWILFEAGALSNQLEKSKVCPLLFDVKNSDLTGPLSTFQSTLFEKTEFKKLMRSINNSLGDAKVSDTVFENVFEAFYPQLEKKVLQLLKDHESLKKDSETKLVERSERDLLEEILKLTRRQYNEKKLERTPLINIEDYEYIVRLIHEYIESQDWNKDTLSKDQIDSTHFWAIENKVLKARAGSMNALVKYLNFYFSKNHRIY
ncbi:MAG: hypothetical protein ACI8ZM_005232 [Crocinitomix sp.]